MPRIMTTDTSGAPLTNTCSFFDVFLEIQWTAKKLAAYFGRILDEADAKRRCEVIVTLQDLFLKLDKINAILGYRQEEMPAGSIDEFLNDNQDFIEKLMHLENVLRCGAVLSLGQSVVPTCKPFNSIGVFQERLRRIHADDKQSLPALEILLIKAKHLKTHIIERQAKTRALSHNADYLEAILFDGLPVRIQNVNEQEYKVADYASHIPTAFSFVQTGEEENQMTPQPSLRAQAISQAARCHAISHGADPLKKNEYVQIVRQENRDYPIVSFAGSFNNDGTLSCLASCTGSEALIAKHEDESFTVLLESRQYLAADQQTLPYREVLINGLTPGSDVFVVPLEVAAQLGRPLHRTDVDGNHFISVDFSPSLLNHEDHSLRRAVVELLQFKTAHNDRFLPLQEGAQWKDDRRCAVPSAALLAVLQENFDVSSNSPLRCCWNEHLPTLNGQWKKTEFLGEFVNAICEAIRENMLPTNLYKENSSYSRSLFPTNDNRRDTVRHFADTAKIKLLRSIRQSNVGRQYQYTLGEADVDQLAVNQFYEDVLPALTAHMMQIIIQKLETTHPCFRSEGAQAYFSQNSDNIPAMLELQEGDSKCYNRFADFVEILTGKRPETLSELFDALDKYQDAVKIQIPLKHLSTFHVPDLRERLVEAYRDLLNDHYTNQGLVALEAKIKQHISLSWLVQSRSLVDDDILPNLTKVITAHPTHVAFHTLVTHLREIDADNALADSSKNGAKNKSILTFLSNFHCYETLQAAMSQWEMVSQELSILHSWFDDERVDIHDVNQQVLRCIRNNTMLFAQTKGWFQAVGLGIMTLGSSAAWSDNRHPERIQSCQLVWTETERKAYREKQYHSKNRYYSKEPLQSGFFWQTDVVAEIQERLNDEIAVLKSDGVSLVPLTQ